MSDNQTNIPNRRGDSLGRVSTPQAIVNRVASEILDGYLEPGVELREVELAERLGVSRPSLREAITQLAYRGLVERRPHKSVRVTELTKADAIDILETRGLIESEAIRRIARDPSKWPDIEEAVARLDRLAETAGWSEIAESDIAFHRTVVHAAGSPRLSRAHDQLVDEMRLLLIPGRRYSNKTEMAHEHRELYEAMRSGDADSAAARLKMHLDDGAQSILEYLPDGS